MRQSLLTILASVALADAQAAWSVGQSVKTTSGNLVGQASSWRTSVSEYLGVPFAQPPTGDLRWAAPQAIKDASKTVNATQFGFSCAESTSRLSRSNPKAPQNIGAAENEMREDCLYLNIWSKPQSGEKKKAVLIWIYGGGFVVGSAANQPYNGALLAEDHDVVVVTVNYRLGVLGFPGVPLPATNLGLLDQRAAVEWLRDNIEKFGGDPKRMTLFGQSAGGASVDWYAYSYTQDPIVVGIIPQSGTASIISRLGGTANKATTTANWSNLSQKIGCGAVTTEDVTKTLACMRSKSADAVLDATAPTSSATALGGWGPKIDEKTVFSDTAARAAKGNFVKIPILVGNVNNEGSSSGTVLGTALSRGSNCGSSQAAKIRTDAGVNAWQYMYAGEFPNLTLGPCCPNATGAWHGSEIALLFGTADRKGKGPDTPNQKKLALAMRNAWTAFAKDPVHGLHKFGWPSFDRSKPSVVVLGGKDSDKITFETHSAVEPVDGCPRE